jgi:hypothetical protein
MKRRVHRADVGDVIGAAQPEVEVGEPRHQIIGRGTSAWMISARLQPVHRPAERQRRVIEMFEDRAEN